MEVKAFRSIVPQEWMGADIAVVEILRPHKENDVGLLGRLDEGMRAKNVVARRRHESVEVQSLVEGHSVVGGGQQIDGSPAVSARGESYRRNDRSSPQLSS